MRANRVIMGTGVSIDIPGLTDTQFIDKLFTRLQKIDNRFSPYKERSELSRFHAGELREQELTKEFRAVMRDCLEMEKLTDGYFSAWFDGEYDPTGYVKGWAIARISKMIEKAAYSTYCVGIGGDINARSSSDKIWSVGLQDPKRKGSLIGHLKAKSLAVATSGIYERGGHVINPKTGRPATELLSLSVTGPDIALADVLATAAFVMGKDGLKLIERQAGYEALSIDRRGKTSATSGMPSLMMR